MLIIRLQRVGRKNYAEFRVIVTEHTRAAKSANYLEIVGHYNPHNNEVTFKEERIKHWREKGAQISDTVHNLLVSEKIIKGEKINVLPRKTPIVKEAKEEQAAPEEKAEPEEAQEEKVEEKATEEKKEETEEEEKKEEPKEA